MNSNVIKQSAVATEAQTYGSLSVLEAIRDDGFDVLPGFEPQPGFLFSRTRAISSRVNQNFDGFPSEELKKAYKTFLGKPVFVNHHNEDPDRARGRVVAARYAEAGDDKYIEVIQEVDAARFPKLAHELETGGLDAVSMGTQAGRTFCSFCGHEAEGFMDMCDHVLAFKGQYLTRTADNGLPEDVLVYEECRDLSFFELSYVFDPADETALVSSVVLASKDKQAFGETESPERVDTLREDDEQEEDDYHRYVEPPTFLSDPDFEVAKETEREENEPDISEFLPFVKDEEDKEDEENSENPDPSLKGAWRHTDDEYGKSAIYCGNIDAEVSDDYGTYSVRVALKNGGQFFDSFGSFDEALEAATRAVSTELEIR